MFKRIFIIILFLIIIFTIWFFIYTRPVTAPIKEKEESLETEETINFLSGIRKYNFFSEII